MELIIGKAYSRKDLKACKFPTWDLVRAFIFERAFCYQNNQQVDIDLLVGIVYDPTHNINAPTHFCVYGKPNGFFDGIFGGNPGSKRIIPVFKSLKHNNVEFVGCFEVVYIGRPRPNAQCVPNLANGSVLVGEIELIQSIHNC